MNIWTILGITFLLIYLSKRFIAEKIHIPAIPLFMVIGVFLGSTGLGVLSPEVYKNIKFISDLVLGIIAFMIGAELSMKMLKRIGKSIFLIALLEVIGVMIIVTTIIVVFTDMPLYIALTFGTVATATAPAATVYVIKHYKAKGKFTSTILGVIAIDDMIALIVFACASVLIQSLMTGGSASVEVSGLVLSALKHIGVSVLIGAVVAFGYIAVARKIKDEGILFSLLLGVILLASGLAFATHSSQLLSIMCFGVILVGLNEDLAHRSVKSIEPLYDALIPIFFVLAGSTFELDFAIQTFFLGMIYVVALMAGRYLGGYTGALLSGVDKKTRNWIGVTLFPQAGVAFGLIVAMQQLFGTPEYGEKGTELIKLVGNILIWTTLITETIGPLMTKLAIKKHGEIGKDH